MNVYYTFFTCCLIAVLQLQASPCDTLWQKLSSGDTTIQLQTLRSFPPELIYSDPLGCESIIDKGIEIARAHENDALQIKLQIYKGWILKSIGDGEEGIRLARETLELSQQNRNRRGEADSYNLLGNFYLEINDYQEALTTFVLASNIYRSLSDTVNYAKTLNNIGLIYRWHGSPPEAVTYYKEALVYLGNRPENRLKTIIHGNIGCASIGSEYYDSAVVHLEKSLMLCDSFNLKPVMINVLVSLALAHIELKQYREAEAYIDQGLSVSHALDNSVKEVELLNLQGRILFETNQIPEARRIAQRNYKLAGKYNLIAQELKALKILVETNIGLNNPEEALKYFDTYYEKRLDYEQIKTSSQLAEMQIKFDTKRRIEKKEDEINHLAKLNSLQASQLKRIRLVRTLMAFSFLLLVIMALLLRNRWVLKHKALQIEKEKSILEQQKLQLEIFHKNRELSASTAFITEKNKILYGLNEQIRMLKGLNGKAYTRLDELSREINQNINLEDDWNIMKMHFENVYPHFFSFLKSRFPTLTPLDLKHCAYVKMKLSNKELARMLNIEPNSVKTLRYRLKKKLELTPEEDLFDFIESSGNEIKVQQIN